MSQRQIVIVGLSEPRIDGYQVVEGFYELVSSNRPTYKYWFGHVRDEHKSFLITTTDRLNELDIRIESIGVSVIRSVE